ncbi:hypothetical protein BDV19DRAFT_390205 [Aspergillus venezuelensis]
MDPSLLTITRGIHRTSATRIYLATYSGQERLLKIYHDNGDEGYTSKGWDLNRFRCETTAYEKLSAANFHEGGFFPRYYGFIDRLDPALPQFQPFLLEGAEKLNCVNNTEALLSTAVERLEHIHRAGVYHQDIYPRNILLVQGDPGRGTGDRLVWVDFDVATTYDEEDPGPKKREYPEY